MNTLFITSIESLLMVFTAWLIYLRTRNAGIIDVFWALNIGIMGTTHLALKPWSHLSTASATLLIFWSLRLALFLFLTRVLKGEVDPRYTKLSESWTNLTLGFLKNFLFQGALAWVIALPFFYIGQQEAISFHHTLLFTIIFISLIFESWADQTLLNYKSIQSGGLCRKGLWKYSRHPNYFFECLLWLGFSLTGIHDNLSLLSLLSPICLYGIMRVITLPLTESESLKKRGKSYRTYQEEVSVFFPMPPKMRR